MDGDIMSSTFSCPYCGNWLRCTCENRQPIFTMEKRTILVAVLVWLVLINVLDAYSTAQLVDIYGWEGEQNILVKPIISHDWIYFVGLKALAMIVVAGVTMFLYRNSPDTIDLQIKILLYYCIFATGIVSGNIIALLTI